MVDPVNHPDREVLDAAHAARASQDAHDEAGRRLGQIEDAFLALVPDPPDRPDSEEGREIVIAAAIRILKTFPVLTPEVDVAVTEIRDRTIVAMQETWDAWDADRKRWYEESGTAAADVAADQSLNATIADVEALAELRATTLDGVKAKATVFRPDPNGREPDAHYQALAMSVMRDLAAMAKGQNVLIQPAGATTV